MTIKQRIENVESWLLRQKGLLGGHEFQVLYIAPSDSFKVVFKKMAHSTLTRFNNLLLERDVKHLVVAVEQMDDDFYPAALQLEQRRRNKRPRRRIKKQLQP